MAIVELNHEETSTTLDEYLRYCQIIADAFTNALDQNECNVKVVVGIAQELTNQRDEVEDLWEIMKPDVYNPPTGDSQEVSKDDGKNNIIYEEPTTITENDIKAIKKKIKEACYDCDYGWPALDFNNNFDWSFQKLKASLDTYISTFKEITNPNFCHAAGAFNFSCLQDLLKLITLLLSAYAGILALRKLSSISLSAFIKGVISGLLGQLIGSLSLQLDLSKTGLSCIIKVFEEIASNVPDGSSMSGVLPENFLYDLGMELDSAKANTNPIKTVKEPIYEEYTNEEGEKLLRLIGYKEVEEPSATAIGLDQYDDYGKLKVEAKQNTSANNTPEGNWYQDTLNNLNDPNGENFLKQFTNKLKEDSEKYQDNVSASFTYVNDVISSATDDFNNVLAQMFGLLDYFQCEAARSGTDFLELLQYMQKLINVINLLSAIVSLVAKKQVEKLCKTKESVRDFSSIINEDVALGGSNDLDPVEIIEEFLGKVVEETVNENDEIIPIIYDKDVDPMLPKLNLLSCNLKEFIEAHTLDNIIKKAIEDVQKDQERDRVTQYDKYTSKYDPSLYPHVSLPSDNVMDKNRWKVYPIQYVIPPYTKTDWKDKPREEQQDELSKITESDYGLQSILDFVYNNPLDRNDPTTPDAEITDKTNPDTNTNTDDKSYRSALKTPSYTPTSKDKNSFENECRSINDVLSILENLKGK